MALRYLARKLRIPATAALQTASSARVSSAKSTLASRSSQNGGTRRAMNGTRNGGGGLKDLEKRIKLEKEKDKQKFEKLSAAIDNLPRNIVLTCGGGTLALSCVWACLCDASHKSSNPA
ncbi:hypothetical protein EJB05_14657 [Eragrostis curvula]|uniref:Uncharacterized protein n=1 Tax=Eragrostis curvula TaxID=38414 RepID=A0A5J9VZ24_9POAL|nr:hypothetical protein EJB05_14657 [Eragrostis curvula]